MNRQGPDPDWWWLLAFGCDFGSPWPQASKPGVRSLVFPFVSSPMRILCKEMHGGGFGALHALHRAPESDPMLPLIQIHNHTARATAHTAGRPGWPGLAASSHPSEGRQGGRGAYASHHRPTPSSSPSIPSGGAGRGPSAPPISMWNQAGKWLQERAQEVAAKADEVCLMKEGRKACRVRLMRTRTHVHID